MAYSAVPVLVTGLAVELLLKSLLLKQLGSRFLAGCLVLYQTGTYSADKPSRHRRVAQMLVHSLGSAAHLIPSLIPEVDSLAI